MAEKFGGCRWTIVVFVAICRDDHRKSRKNLVVESERAHSYRLANGLLLCNPRFRSEICRHMAIVLASGD